MFRNNFMVDLLRGGQQGNVQPQQFMPQQVVQQPMPQPVAPQARNIMQHIGQKQRSPLMQGAYNIADTILSDAGTAGDNVRQQIARQYRENSGM